MRGWGMQGAVLMHVCARVLVRARVTHEADVPCSARSAVPLSLAAQQW